MLCGWEGNCGPDMDSYGRVQLGFCTVHGWMDVTQKFAVGCSDAVSPST